MTHHPYTVLLRGGDPCTLQPQGNPIMHHNGGMSVTTWMLTSSQKEEVERVFQSYGVKVTLTCHQEDPEIKQRLMDIQNTPIQEWPTPKCPSCTWFDPLMHPENPCGYDSWDPSVRDMYLDMPNARVDLTECPLDRPLDE